MRPQAGVCGLWPILGLDGTIADNHKKFVIRRSDFGIISYLCSVGILLRCFFAMAEGRERAMTASMAAAVLTYGKRSVVLLSCALKPEKFQLIINKMEY